MLLADAKASGSILMGIDPCYDKEAIRIFNDFGLIYAAAFGRVEEGMGELILY